MLAFEPFVSPQGKDWVGARVAWGWFGSEHACIQL